jgi:hypothetical protein
MYHGAKVRHIITLPSDVRNPSQHETHSSNHTDVTKTLSSTQHFVFKAPARLEKPVNVKIDSFGYSGALVTKKRFSNVTAFCSDHSGEVAAVFGLIPGVSAVWHHSSVALLNADRNIQESQVRSWMFKLDSASGPDVLMVPGRRFALASGESGWDRGVLVHRGILLILLPS